MGANTLLVLQAPEVRERMTNLLERMETDQGLQQLYVNDPAGVIQKFVFPDQTGVPAAEINRGNRMLYSLLSNNAFLAWARDYEQNLLTQAREATQIEDPASALSAYLTVTDRGRLHDDLAGAVAEFGDKELIASLTWHPDLPRIGTARLPINADVAVDIETFIYAVAAVAVFAVAVAAVFVGEQAAGGDEIVNRIDIQAIANQLSAQLAARATDVRASGVLTNFAQRNVGYTR